MQTAQSEPSKARPLSQLQEQLLKYGDLFDETDQPSQVPPKGVVQDILDQEAGGPMSLGTSRLCNDLKVPRPLHTFPTAAIEWNRITMYHEPSIKPRDPNTNPPNIDNLTRGIYNGYMSPATKRKFRRIASTWLRSIMLYRAEVKRKWDPGRAYPTMITLTLPVQQVHTDREIYRACLMPWIQMMRREYSIEQYVWRAEAQENGNLHYHVIVDRYIPKRAITLSWNQAIDNLDYRARYFVETGSLEPPSTEVHALKEKVQDPETKEWRTVDPVDYLVDYLMDAAVLEPEEPQIEGEEPKPRKLIGHYRDKDGKHCTYITRPITGRVWGMSDQLRTIKEPKARASLPLINALEAARKTGAVRRVDKEHATMYFGKISVVLGRADPGAWHVIKEFYLQIFGHIYKDQLPPEHIRKFPPMDPDGLWIDLDNYAFYYPPSRSERQDEYAEKNPTDDRLQVSYKTGKGYLTPVPEWSWKLARIKRKLQRLGLKDLLQRWVVKDRPVFA